MVEALSDWGGRVHAVTGGERFLAAGVSVQAYGQQHAVVHPDVPAIDNTGFLIADRVFHPGDALTVPDVPVETLLVPVHAPWLRVADAIDWVRAIAPGRAVAMHDCGLSRIGRAVVERALGRAPAGDRGFRRAGPGRRAARPAHAQDRQLSRNRQGWRRDADPPRTERALRAVVRRMPGVEPGPRLLAAPRAAFRGGGERVVLGPRRAARALPCC